MIKQRLTESGTLLLCVLIVAAFIKMYLFS
ncbi:Uncharacterised protein [Shimwellia blattae]|nr:Uncharacterised protein [Shimwellia blattae]VEC24205.1 Uncharacterised protein [Shimwellia blattae]